MVETHILIVEDDPEISDLLAAFLRQREFVVSVAAGAEAAQAILADAKIDLILLDVMLPGESGLDLCRRLRASGGPRIIMLTAMAEPTDKVVGLELGADDYVAKPFDARELLARIRAVMRRAPLLDDAPQAAPAPPTSLRFAGHVFDPYGRFVRAPSGLRITLTGAESDLLRIFCEHPRQILSREELITLTRGEGFAISARSIDLLVSRLRRKLNSEDPLADPIRTVRADGYAFYPDVSTE